MHCHLNYLRHQLLSDQSHYTPEVDDLQIAWVLVWRNANMTHHYAPYDGHESVEDFRLFRNDRRTLFENDLNEVYKKPKKK